MARASSCLLLLAALVVLASGASAESGRFDMPSASLPALAAAPLIFSLVPNPTGATTWAERELEEIRLGVKPEMREEASTLTSFVLLALHAARTAGAYALEMTEAPRDEPTGAALTGAPARLTDAYEERRIVGALEAMGLRPEDLVPKAELSAGELMLAEAMSTILATLFKERTIDHEPGDAAASLRVAPEDKYEREPAKPRFRKPPLKDELPAPALMIFAKRVTRSVYKILLGVAIGVLIWGFVRNT